ncbi:universal stress protein [Halostagnicola bangensis]
MYKTLVCLDKSDEQARKQAEEITAMPMDPDAHQIQILHVFTDNPDGIAVPQVSSVRTAMDVFNEHGIEPEIIGTSGEPEREIRRVANDNDVDLISLGGRKRSPTGKAIFGSVTQEVILEADRPVVCQPL